MAKHSKKIVKPGSFVDNFPPVDMVTKTFDAALIKDMADRCKE